jgi:hypothetical protein
MRLDLTYIVVANILFDDHLDCLLILGIGKI